MKGVDKLVKHIQTNGTAVIADKHCKNQKIYIDHNQEENVPLSAYNHNFRIDLCNDEDNLSGGKGDKYLRADTFVRKTEDDAWIRDEQSYMDKIERDDTLENQLVRLLNLFAFLEEYEVPEH